MDQIDAITAAARGAQPNTALADAKVSVVGLPVVLKDTRDYSDHDLRLIIAMTVCIVLLILIVLLRAIVAPLYLIGSVIVSYLAALGIGVIVFQFLLGQEMHWSIPGLTFVILVAVGADYNMLLISRLREEAVLGCVRCHPDRGLNRWCDHCGGFDHGCLDVRSGIRQLG